MVRFGHADLRIWPRALLLGDHEGNHAREIGPQREELQIEHERKMIFKDRWRSQWLGHAGKLDIALFFGPLDAAPLTAGQVVDHLARPRRQQALRRSP